MLDPLGNERLFGLLRTAMDAASTRHEVVAGNLANIDTPGYKARDLDFEKILQDFDQQRNMMPDTRAGLMRGQQQPEGLDFRDYLIEKEAIGLTQRWDGNNVDLDEEMAKLSRARGRYLLATQFMSRKSRLLSEIINSRV